MKHEKPPPPCPKNPKKPPPAAHHHHQITTPQTHARLSVSFTISKYHVVTSCFILTSPTPPPPPPPPTPPPPAQASLAAASSCCLFSSLSISASRSSIFTFTSLSSVSLCQREKRMG
ncbi:hypothetical protein E2C01_028091 [Portunus trituberculatus]|uniref:Uncharacterized protein n=1 Tax=Portunus trituberculatus TaxID=210409 RepID=A0A5B7EJR8_PORTR|nr:hypothetical protein [Portunus trituberculatus]